MFCGLCRFFKVIFATECADYNLMVFLIEMSSPFSSHVSIVSVYDSYHDFF